MTTKSANYFECKIKHSTVLDNGTEKMVSEIYVVDAETYTEAEARITKEMAAYYQDFSVVYIKPAKYKEIAFVGEEKKVDTTFYKCTIAFITLDEKSGKEKRTRYIILVEGTSLKSAVSNLDEAMKGSMIEYDSVTVTRTNITEIL